MRIEFRLAVLAALIAAACDSGPPTVADACQSIAHAYCVRLANLGKDGCVDAAGIIASFGSESACETQITFIDPSECVGSPECPATEEYSSDHAGSCVGDIGNISCSGDFDLDALPSSCSAICCLPSGADAESDDGASCCSGSAHAVNQGCITIFSVPPNFVCD